MRLLAHPLKISVHNIARVIIIFIKAIPTIYSVNLNYTAFFALVGKVNNAKKQDAEGGLVDLVPPKRSG